MGCEATHRLSVSGGALLKERRAPAARRSGGGRGRGSGGEELLGRDDGGGRDALEEVGVGTELDRVAVDGQVGEVAHLTR
jgi:hypothetical protein